MPIVHPCASDGCDTLTMGELCLDCELELAGASIGIGAAVAGSRHEPAVTAPPVDHISSG